MATRSSQSKFNIKKSAVGIIATSNGNVNVTGNVNVNVYDASQNDLEFSDFDLPRLISTFKGREEEIQMLDALYFTQKEKNVVICGLPGFGKTELSKQYANRCVENSKIHRVFWVNSENKDDLRNSIKTLRKIYKIFKEKITMFIFDNAACMQDIFDYMPPDNENNLLLITSREKDWIDIKPVPLDPLSSASAVEVYKSFLKGYYREEHHDMYVKLAAVVDYVPLGLQITGAFVREQIMALQEKFDFGHYITLLQESKKDILNATIPPNVPNPYQNSIYGAICISLKKIQTAQNTKRGDLAINILYMCSYLDPDHIEFHDLLEMSVITDLLETNNNNEYEIKLALHLLTNLLFINYKHNDKYLTIHRLIQDVVRLYLLKCDDEIKTKAYTASLQFTFETTRQFYYFSHCNSVLVYADENMPSILNFYKKHALKGNEILRRFLTSLTAFECLTCITNIVEGMNTKYLTEYNLLYEDLLKIINHYEIDFNKTDAVQISPLHVAASEINLHALKIITACNVDLNARDCNGETALFHFIRSACKREKTKLDEDNQILNILKLNENINIKNNYRETLLHYAAHFSSHNTELLYQLLKRGLDVNSRNNEQSTALHAAALESNLDAVKLLIKYNADLNARNFNGDTPLFTFISGTCRRKKLNIDGVNQILNLLKLNENINIRNNNGETLLYYAAYFSSQNTDLLHLLLKSGLDVNSKNENQCTALHAAASEANLDAMKLLTKYNVDLNARDCDGETALFHFISGTCKREKIKLDEDNQILDLLKLDENKNVRNNLGQTLLYYAAYFSSRNTELLHLLLKRGLDVNSRNDDKSTALHAAALNSNLNAVKLLIKYNMDINARDCDGDTALFTFISGTCKLEKINIDEVNQIFNILNFNENINIKNNNGETLLYYAAYFSSHNAELLHLLLKHGLDVNSKNGKHGTALHAAAVQGNLDAIKLLIKNNVDLNARNCNGETALFCFLRGTCKRDNINIDELNEIWNLLQCKANKNDTNNHNDTLLFLAAESCHENIITFLITQCDMNVNHQNLQGDTPLHNFIKLKDLLSRSIEDIIRTVETLKKHGAHLDIKNKNGKTPLLLARDIRAEFLIPYLTEANTVSGVVATRQKYKWMLDIKSKLKKKFM